MKKVTCGLVTLLLTLTLGVEAKISNQSFQQFVKKNQSYAELFHRVKQPIFKQKPPYQSEIKLGSPLTKNASRHGKHKKT
ncbi:hypothetical protein HR060_12765 [Catenovulum sp. SM1970]|uniref:hypothetical protein n=1 Tax=Marinifaba aquimaris TaxID=2741323 RepID=UPI001573FFAA|nr:hypothetical protein [Marinifaba aquimaris]NTS77733.1 hypothetical protein [Marinifaba aquimaris]